MCGVWFWLVGRHDFTLQMCFDFGGTFIGDHRMLLCKKILNGDAFMRVIVVKSPRLLGGILRKMFGIQKAQYID